METRSRGSIKVPVLVIIDSSSTNKFSSYILEILDIEGIFSRDHIDLSKNTLSMDLLKQYGIVITANIQLPTTVKKLLNEFVKYGGNLICLKPPIEMGGLFGLIPQRLPYDIDKIAPLMPKGGSPIKTIWDCYIMLEENHRLGNELVTKALQFHGPADLYDCKDTEVLAFISADTQTKSTFPAIVTYENNGSKTAAFAYDLAASTVLFHQGLYENSSLGKNANPERDGRWMPDNLFVNHLDPRFIDIPQADIHQDILVRIINWMSESAIPVPKVWYFPDAVPGIGFINGDSDHMDREDYLKNTSIVEKYGGKHTIYLMKDHCENVIDSKLEKELIAKGHSFGRHNEFYWLISLDEAKKQSKEGYDYFKERFGHPPLTNRGHCLVWPGWTEMAEILSDNGVRIDTNFLSRTYCPRGYLNGSALPVKFMNEKGQLIDLYEQNTTIDDSGFEKNQKFLSLDLNKQETIRLALKMLDDCIYRYHGVYNVNFHPERAVKFLLWLLEEIAKRCWELQIPMVSGDEWANFNDARRGVEIRKVKYQDNIGKLTFTISGKTMAYGLTVLLPASINNRRCISLEINKQQKSLIIKRFKGIAYTLAVLDILPGNEYQIEAIYK